MTDIQYDDKALPVKTAFFGAILGAAAVFLSRKETRDKIKDAALKMMDQTEKKIDRAMKKAEKTTNSLARQIERKTQPAI